MRKLAMLNRVAVLDDLKILPQNSQKAFRKTAGTSTAYASLTSGNCVSEVCAGLRIGAFDQERSFNADNQMPTSDWQPTFTWSLSLAAFDDKAEIQEFESIAVKPTLTIVC